mgnify:CR=1 FL=1
MLCEFGRVTVWEKIAVDFLELLDRELAVGTVLEEALVPLLDFRVGKLSVGLEVVQHLGLELAVLLSHDGGAVAVGDGDSLHALHHSGLAARILLPRGLISAINS